MVEELNSGLPRKNSHSSRVEDLNLGPPDVRVSASKFSDSGRTRELKDSTDSKGRSSC